MVKTIIHDVVHEIRELGKDTAYEVVKQTKESGKDVFQSIIGMQGVKAPGEEKLKEDTKKKAIEEQQLKAQMRRRLREAMTGEKKAEPTVYERIQQEDLWRKQRQVELAKQKQKQQLPVITTRPQQGNLQMFKKRQQANVEMGKTPGQ